MPTTPLAVSPQIEPIGLKVYVLLPDISLQTIGTNQLDLSQISISIHIPFSSL